MAIAYASELSKRFTKVNDREVNKCGSEIQKSK